jgi:hypothetical protein
MSATDDADQSRETQEEPPENVDDLDTEEELLREDQERSQTEQQEELP